MTDEIRVFISYSHEDEKHKERVRFLSDKLRSNGIESHIDQYIEHDPPADWSLWMEDEIEEADFILVVCTPTYYERYRKKGPKDKGLGVKMEGAILRRELYNLEENKSRFIPIFFLKPNKKIIPDPISESTNYQPLTDQGYKSLYHRLTDIPLVETPPVAKNGLKLTTKPAYNPATQSLTVNLPPRNPFFTGRKDILTNLHKSFNNTKSLAITQTQAIKGLGGVGKSETAIEYAHRRRDDYNAVFWVGAETPGELLKDFALIGVKLGIAKDSEPDTFREVISWMENNEGWLLVLDNVEDLTSIQQIIPSPCNGHVLITTRSNATGRINNYSLDCMNEEDGALLLLRRSKIIGEKKTLRAADEEQQKLAKTISSTLGGLPLALDQAGAYIEEYGCGLKEYLEIYEDNKNLLDKRGELSQATHPDSVAVTFALCFDKVQQTNPTSAQLLEMCAFLAPDDIPEEMFTDGAPKLPDDLQAAASNKESWIECIAAAAHLSLLVRNAQNKTFSIHRLVQEVLRQRMDKDKQKAAAGYCVQALSKVYPPGDTDFKNWPQCSRLTPHAQSLFKWIVDYSLEANQATHLLNQTALYLYHQARYAEAEPLYLRAIEIGEKTLGAEHPDLATRLNNLAGLYDSQDKYEQAEPLYLRVKKIFEDTDRTNHPNYASTLNNLALLYDSQGKYEQAEPLYLRAIEIGEKALGAEHPTLAAYLNNLAALYDFQGKYEQAEPMYLQAIEIDEKALGKDHPQLATHLNNLAGLYYAQGKYEQVEPLIKRVIEIDEKTLPDDHPNLALRYENYARFLQKTEREAEAREYEAKAQAIRQKRGE